MAEDDLKRSASHEKEVGGTKERRSRMERGSLSAEETEISSRSSDAPEIVVTGSGEDVFEEKSALPERKKSAKRKVVDVLHQFNM